MIRTSIIGVSGCSIFAPFPIFPPPLIFSFFLSNNKSVAKEQGLRSRAAFKLSQINRQYPILDRNTKVVLDLCAAPGGWTQIAAREGSPDTHVVAVDILPIRRIPAKNQQTITTIVGDITTDKCKAEINRAIAGSKVDVVLHDGAPNVGASYDKDAYEQIELSVHALRCATNHLKKGGVFVTKIYRSRDSQSFQWVVQQFFQEVTSFKPKASRPQSAEIFYVCQGYHAPKKIDPRLLDPKHIFEMVEGDTTGGGNLEGGSSEKFHVFHKNWEKANKRHRDGYDMNELDANLRRVEPLHNFIHVKGSMGAIQLLSSCTGFSFTCPECSTTSTKKDEETNCDCKFLLHHPLTTPEIKECVVDLKVLNKGDFKGIMIWREKMLQALDAIKEDSSDDDDDDDGESVEENEREKRQGGEEENEDEIQKEIQALRERKLRQKKKAKKKERKLAAKKRRQAALGMDLNAIELQEDDQFFSLDTLKSSGDLHKISEVNIDQATDDQVFGADSDEDDDEDANLGKHPEKDEKTGYSYRLEKDLDSAYERYLEGTKNGAAKKGTKAAKRSKKLMREKLAEESHEDHELLLTNSEGLNEDARRYAEMLQGPKDSDDEDSDGSSDSGDDDDDGYDAPPMSPKDYNERKTKKQRVSAGESKNPLIHKFEDDPTSVKTARWFSNPLFASIGQAAESAQESASSKRGVVHAPMVDVDSSSSESDSDQEEEDASPPAKRKARIKTPKDSNENSDSAELDPENILAMIPKTDKQKRHEKRLKALARDERRQARKAKKLGEAEGEFALAPEEDDGEDEEEQAEIAKMEGLSEEKKQKLLKARELIKAGMGSGMGEVGDDGNKAFEVVEADRPLPVMDDRKYDSGHEDYDSDDYAKTMALGTMMLRNSKAKALVDASYNRYAWNDPDGLPEWFVDDENRHYRPQLPIPDALLQKMKEKQAALSVRPIAKVAEARARKNRKAQLKLSAAKKKAQALAGSSEMSESMKLKQISKALRSSDGKKGGKEYMVAKKGRKGVKGTISVDKRMKNDKRAMDRAQKKKKGGKKGGLVGSKRRRQHS